MVTKYLAIISDYSTRIYEVCQMLRVYEIIFVETAYIILILKYLAILI